MNILKVLVIVYFIKNAPQVGVHERGSGLKDVSPLEHWEQRWESEKMPKKLPRIGIEMETIPDFLHQAIVLADKYHHVKLKLLHFTKDVDLALDQPKDELIRTLHVTSLPNIIDAPLPNLVEEPWPPFPANCSVPPSNDPGFLIHILWTLILRKIPVLTVPLHPTPSDKRQWTAQSGQRPPLLGQAFFPATLSTFQIIHGKVKVHELKHSLLNIHFQEWQETAQLVHFLRSNFIYHTVRQIYLPMDNRGI